MLQDRTAKVEEMEVKLIVARKQMLAKEGEMREVLSRAEAAEENGRFLKAQCELRKKESVARVRKDYEERICHIEMAQKETAERRERDYEEELKRTVSESKKL